MPTYTAAADEYFRRHLTESNAIRWPDDNMDRANVAQTLIALHFIGNADYWYEWARDHLTNPQPPEPYVRPWSDFAKKDRAYREAFATLNDEQREAVLRLVRNVADGATYSSLVKLDQFPHANVVIQLVNRDDEPPLTVQAVPGPDGRGIHEQWSNWVREFSTR